MWSSAWTQHNVDGYVSKYKTRLVTKGYAQTYGIDYEKTYGPVAKMTTLRTIIAMATTKGWSLHQMDVNNVFFHGDLQEEMYMEQPLGYVDQTHPNLVCRLKKALYGLKQTPRAWLDKIGQSVSYHKWISNIQCGFFTICEKDRSWDCYHSHLC